VKCVNFLFLLLFSPLVIDSADFERVRFELEQLGREHAELQSAYRDLAESSRFFADFHRSATEAIGLGLGELSALGADSLGEIAQLRELVAILRSIVQVVLDADAGIGTGER
jgi:hypothetical protein